MKISQREARRLRKRVRELEDVERRRFSAYASSYPGGANFATLLPDQVVHAKCEVVQLLGCAIVARVESSGRLLLFAVAP